MVEINGKSKEYIMGLQTRQVHAAGRVWMAKYDPTTGTVYQMDDAGNLTGRIAVLKLAPQPDVEKQAAPAEDAPKDNAPKTAKRPDKQETRQMKRAQKEQAKAEQKANKQARAQKKAGRSKREPDSHSVHFHPGCFFAGMLMVILAVIALYLVRLGVYEGLL